ncbi:MAG: thermonuclease family protein [Elusimicrobiota bacterium]|nr:thermonuclease family protein [Elusimicrobiota bacterium]
MKYWAKSLFVFLLILFLSSVAFTEKLDTSKYSFVDWTVPHIIEEVRVEYVFDGDTVKTADGQTIRLMGVDTPEIAHPSYGKPYGEPGGEEAKAFAIKQIEGKDIILVIDKENTKRTYGRILGLIFYNDENGKQRCFNWELIKTGYGPALIYSDNRLCMEDDWDTMSTASSRKTPNNFYTLAEQYSAEGLEEEAIKIYQAGLKKFPSEIGFYEELAALYDVLNLPGLEVDAYLACLEKNPDSVDIRRKLAIAYEKMVKAVGWVARGGYKENAMSEWKKLSGTKYEKEARTHLAMLEK